RISAGSLNGNGEVEVHAKAADGGDRAGFSLECLRFPSRREPRCFDERGGHRRSLLDHLLCGGWRRRRRWTDVDVDLLVERLGRPGGPCCRARHARGGGYAAL